ncbi:hypothetical protein ACNQ1D_26515, partial [Enterobacter cloacae complex sp.6700005]|uniref:hypothetical protein n=1 Tax=Enterobacter cloacae complex sp.6700005 TaxID=3397180 RepID=UPI003AAD9855
SSDNSAKYHLSHAQGIQKSCSALSNVPHPSTNKTELQQFHSSNPGSVSHYSWPVIPQKPTKDYAFCH